MRAENKMHIQFTEMTVTKMHSFLSIFEAEEVALFITFMTVRGLRIGGGFQNQYLPLKDGACRLNRVI